VAAAANALTHAPHPLWVLAVVIPPGGGGGDDGSSGDDGRPQ